jgi:hypothetical protein
MADFAKGGNGGMVGRIDAECLKNKIPLCPLYKGGKRGI